MILVRPLFFCPLVRHSSRSGDICDDLRDKDELPYNCLWAGSWYESFPQHRRASDEKFAGFSTLWTRTTKQSHAILSRTLRKLWNSSGRRLGMFDFCHISSFLMAHKNMQAQRRLHFSSHRIRHQVCSKGAVSGGAADADPTPEISGETLNNCLPLLTDEIFRPTVYPSHSCHGHE